MDRAIYDAMRLVEDRHWWFAGRRQIVAQVLRRLSIKAAPTILELGCGTGGNLEMLASMGSVIGVELDPEAARVAQARAIAPILEGALPDRLPTDLGQFDLVMMLDVLEHIDDDVASLARVGTLLAENGCLVLAVPAFSFLWSNHDVVHHHRRRYTADLLGAVLTGAGLEPLRITYFNTLLFPLVAAARLAGRLLPERPTAAALRVPPRPVNALLQGVFSSEGRLLDHVDLPFGVSLLAVARRPSLMRNGVASPPYRGPHRHAERDTYSSTADAAGAGYQGWQVIGEHHPALCSMRRTYSGSCALR